MSSSSPSSPLGKDFRPVISNLSIPIEDLEEGEHQPIAPWTKVAAKELQQTRSDWKGWLITQFYETWAGNGIRKFANFVVELFKCITEFRPIKNTEDWNRPEPSYFKIHLNDGSTAFYSREAAFRLGYRHVLATVPLHRVEGQIELDPAKIPNPLQRRKLELLQLMLQDKVRSIPFPVIDSNLDTPVDTNFHALLTDYLSHYKTFQEVPPIYKNIVKFYNAEMEKLLDEYDFINPNKDSDKFKYQEFTAFIEKQSKNLPMEELSRQARAVIDIAGRIDAVAKSSMKVTRRTFIALITGAELLPEKIVPGARFFNERAVKVAKTHLRLAAGAYIRSLLQHLPQEKREQVRETIREFIVDERLYGLKRSAFIKRIHGELEAEKDALKIDEDLMDIDSEGEGALASIARQLGLPKKEYLDPISTFELFLQLGFLKKDEHVIEKRLEVNSFLTAYQKLVDTNQKALRAVDLPEANVSDHEAHVWVNVDSSHRVRYELQTSTKSSMENIEITDRLSSGELLDLAISYCNEPAILRATSLRKLSGIIQDNILWLKKNIYDLSRIASRNPGQSLELKRLQNRLHECSMALDKLNAEFGIRGDISKIQLSPKGELASLYAKHQMEFAKFYCSLQKFGISQLSKDPEFAKKIEAFEKDTVQCLHKVKRRIVEASSDTERILLEQQLKYLKEHVWVLNLLKHPMLEKMCELEKIEKDTKEGYDNSLTPYYDLQIDVFKNAPTWVTKAPQEGKGLLERIWGIFDVKTEDLPAVAQKLEETLIADKPFFNRISSLAAIDPKAFYKVTDIHKIDQYLEYLFPLNEKINNIIDTDADAVKKHPFLSSTAATIQEAVDMLHAGREIIIKHARNTSNQAVLNAAGIKETPASKTAFTESAKKVLDAKNKYFDAWLALETDYFDVYHQLAPEKDRAYSNLVQGPKFKDLIQRGEEWEQCVKDVLNDLNKSEMPEAYAELEKALQVISGQLPYLYQRNAEALHEVLKMRAAEKDKHT